MERYVSEKTHRRFSIDDLDVRLGLSPTITMRNLYFQNAPWSSREPMASVKTLQFQVSLASLWKGRPVIPVLSIVDANVSLERTSDGRKNWLLADPNDRSPSKLMIQSLAVNGGTITYIDQNERLELHVSDVGRNSSGELKSEDPRFQTRLRFDGRFRDAPFAGEALTTSLLTFQHSDASFPVLGMVRFGKTRLDVDGTIADLADVSAIDAELKIRGASLANLYPFLLLPLPASPAYAVDGHLDFRGTTYRYGNFHGTIGSTDIAGDGTYLSIEPRPKLRLDLRTQNLNLTDLGPLLGVQTQSGSGAPSVEAALGTRTQAAASEHAANSDRHDPENADRLLPIGTVDPQRMKVLDADVRFAADRIRGGGPLFDSLHFQTHLEDGLLHMDPVDLGLAGGHIIGHLVLDARSLPMANRADIDARGLDLARFIPDRPPFSTSGGKIGGRLELEGQGDSIAHTLANASGYARVALSGGKISNLADAAVGLNGGKVLDLLVTGDKTIAVRCGAADFEFDHGIGRSKALVLDTEQTRTEGSGTLDLRDEKFDVVLKPQPKDPGIFSLRAPIRFYGSFKHADYEIDKGVVAAHVGGAVALGILNPLAALVPLLETGPGEDANCRALLEPAPPKARSTGQPQAGASPR